MKTLKKFAAAGMASGLMTFGAAEAAFAQTVNFGPEIAVNGPTTVSVSVPVPSTVTGDGSLSVTLFGDFSAGNPGEYLRVIVEGTQVGGDITSGSQCGADGTEILTVPESVLQSAAADGTVNIEFQSGPAVNFGCTSANSAAFNYSGSADFAVLGSLTYTGGGGAVSDSGTGEATMMANRGAMIMANTVDKQRRIDRLRNGTAVTREALSFEGVSVMSDSPVGIAVDQGRLNFAAGADWGDAMLWAEGRIALLEDDATNDAQFGILHFGVDWMVTSDMLVGVTASIDSFDQYDIGSDTDFSGVGWMIGPIVTARVAPNLYVNGRLAYGQADNDAQRSGGKDSFDSERALAEISLTGEMTHGAYTVFPAAELSYFREKSDAYTSATYGQVAEAEVELGQARLGALIERPFELMPGQNATGFADLSAVYTERYAGTLAAGSFAEEIDGFSGEAEVGMRFETKGGMTVGASVGAGGLFSDAESYSARLSLNIPLR